MKRGVTSKKFEADLPVELTDAYDAWAKDRPRRTNTQIVEAMWRLFLAAPEAVKLTALTGTIEQIAHAIRSRESALGAGLVDAVVADVKAPGETQGIPAANGKQSQTLRGRGRKRG
jgi:hypothetical protein